MNEYDVVLLSDFRFPGGTSSAVAEEIKANAAAGYRTALVHIEAPNLTFPFPINGKIRALIDRGDADLIAPDESVSARLALIHNPYVMQKLPLRPLRVRAEQRLMIVQHPPLAGDGEPYYEVQRICLHADEALGGEVVWAPVGPLVRAQFERMPGSPDLIPHDWYNIVDPGLWATLRNGAIGDRPVIGRHSRPDRRKWPDSREDTLAAYPDDPRFAVRVLGGAPFLIDLLGGYPRNWKVWRFNTYPAEQFVKTIDFFVYYHHSRWIEAFGCTIAEAMASGAVVVLPPHFEPLFEDAALYAPPSGVADLVRAHHVDRTAYRRQSERGRELVEAKFSPAAHIRRLERMIGPPRPRQVAVPVARGSRNPGPVQRVLFLASNGVGMGHLTRLLAVACRCPPPIEPVFATMSQGLKVVHEMGYLAEHLPDHRYLDCEVYRWNKYLCQEIDELIAFYGPSVVVFDCNCPYQGLIDAIGHNPAVWFLWCRRGMWRPGAGAEFIRRERFFDAVIEPTDLAGAFDAGLTAQSRERTRLVAPIRLLDKREMLPREVARRELGLDLQRPAVLIQLGSGNNYDYDAMRRLVLDHLAARPDVQVAVAEWLMSNKRPDLPPGVLRLRRFPLARWFRAFDAAVSAVGYNSFHELIFAGVPTLFIPNENPQQDDQIGRARYAERHGLGLCLRTREIYQLKPALDRLLDAGERAAIRERCAELDPTNGAVEAARMVEEYAGIRRVERDRAA